MQRGGSQSRREQSNRFLCLILAGPAIFQCADESVHDACFNAPEGVRTRNHQRAMWHFVDAKSHDVQGLLHRYCGWASARRHAHRPWVPCAIDRTFTYSQSARPRTAWRVISNEWRMVESRQVR